MKTDQLNGLIALKVVAEHRNFRQAAKTLGISASAVSQTIKQLEKRLGVALLSRTTRSTSLTEAGQHFLDEAGPALDQIISVMDRLGAYASRPSGILKLTFPKSVYLRLAPEIVAFQKKYPEVSVEIVFDEDRVNLVEKGFDAGIRLSETLAKDMVAVRVLGPIRFVTVASLKYLEESGRPKHPKELLGHNCVRLRIGKNGFYDQWEFESRGKDFRVQVSGSLILNDSTLILTAAIAGSGIIYYPEDIIKNQIASGQLEVVLSQYAATSDGYFLYFPQRAQMLPKLRAFVDHLKYR